MGFSFPAPILGRKLHRWRMRRVTRARTRLVREISTPLLGRSYAVVRVLSRKRMSTWSRVIVSCQGSSNNRPSAAIARILYGVSGSRATNVKYAASSYTRDATNTLHSHALELTRVLTLMTLGRSINSSSIPTTALHSATIAVAFFMVSSTRA
ncbi:uncharacterized protein LOC107273513 isoform X2 [Cephus cinctus]|uniref:Uncharacterized protein LOC107273513 isoform X2 n=1 Tax=Cephus cinctus TaxID=211228 RepID=A0AAJ7RT32_CEPCN|nr:uncharacterized protein LOC107273513 isoform X2 [Cephus cinctus]